MTAQLSLLQGRSLALLLHAVIQSDRASVRLSSSEAACPFSWKQCSPIWLYFPLTDSEALKGHGYPPKPSCPLEATRDQRPNGLAKWSSVLRLVSCAEEWPHHAWN